MRYRIKVVPNKMPNADGEWITAELPEPLAFDHPTGNWPKIEAAFKEFIPEDHHIVQVKIEGVD